jgi:hypothetical protein
VSSQRTPCEYSEYPVSTQSTPCHAIRYGSVRNGSCAPTWTPATTSASSTCGSSRERAPFPLAPFPLAPFPLAPFPLAPFPLAPFPLAPFPLAPFPLAPFPLAPFLGPAPASQHATGADSFRAHVRTAPMIGRAGLRGLGDARSLVTHARVGSRSAHLGPFPLRSIPT